MSVQPWYVDTHIAVLLISLTWCLAEVPIVMVSFALQTQESIAQALQTQLEHMDGGVHAVQASPKP